VRTDFIEVEVNGNRFRIYLDAVEAGALHISARHGMMAEDAAALFFAGQPSWNEQRSRFENRVGQQVLYWAWLHGQENGTVLVLSCFEKQEDKVDD